MTLILVLALALACATPVAAKGISQTISFAPLAGQIYGASPFTVSATASSGLPVTYASTTKATCAVNGNEVTLAAAGNCTIQATQSGNESYAAAPKVSQSFAIAKADQTITFAALPDMPLAAASFVLAATASSGLVVKFATRTKSVCAVKGGTVTLLVPGTCTIQASQSGDANYEAAANVLRSFTVTAQAGASQTIAFGPLADVPLSASPVPLDATASSGLPVTFSTVTTSVCTVAGNLVTLVATGTCTVRASQAGDPAFAPAPDVERSFVIGVAPDYELRFRYDAVGNLVQATRVTLPPRAP